MSSATIISGWSAKQVKKLEQGWKIFKSDIQKGKEVVQFLAPFYSTDFKLTLNPPAWSTDDNCKRTFNWLCHDRLNLNIVTPNDFSTNYTDIVKGELHTEFPGPSTFLDPSDLGALVSLELIKLRTDEHLDDLLRAKISSLFRKQTWNDHYEPKNVTNIIHQSVIETIKHVIGLCLLDGYGSIPPGIWQTYFDLRDLWLKGNFPLGFDTPKAHEINSPSSTKTVAAIILSTTP